MLCGKVEPIPVRDRVLRNVGKSLMGCVTSAEINVGVVVGQWLRIHVSC